MAARKKIRGLTAQRELNEDFLYRDTRSASQKLLDWLAIPNNMFAALMILSVGAFFAFPVSDLLLLLALMLFLWARSRRETAPLKMPIQTKFLDPNEPHPGHGGPTPGQGIFFLGNELVSGKEIWLTNSDARQHFLVVGTTGAGKTESLIGFAANAIMWGSGFLFCDGKGDVGLFAKVYALARRFGREDDLLVLNFMTGNSDVGASGGKLMSNTLNPFSTGSSDSLTQMVVSLMDAAGGEGGMWKGRATAMLTGVLRALTWLRDEGVVDLNVGEIREFMSLKRIIDLADTSKYPDLPQHIRKTIKSYLTSLPGFQEDKGYKQSQTTLDQHGYLEMQFTKILGSLADVYGHIFNTPYGEVDMHDVVLNRRILVIMLPALEKSGDEIANLGKIVVATLKGMMGSTLGSGIEGNWTTVVDNRPTNSPSPFICVLDEVGYYTVEGMALMAAQARSLGFSMCYASQDIPAMKRLNEKEAASIIANTNTKIFMRSEEAETTGNLAVNSAGKALAASVGGYEGKSTEFGMGYRVNTDASISAKDRIDWVDLKAQTEGMMHVVFQDKIVRAKSFYANPEGSVRKDKLKLRANHFIKVAKPDIEELERSLRLPGIMSKLVSTEFYEAVSAEAAAAEAAVASKSNDLQAVAATYEAMITDGGRKDLEAACAAVGSIIHKEKLAASEFNRVAGDAYDIRTFDEEQGGSGLNLFGDDLLGAGIDAPAKVPGAIRPPPRAGDFRRAGAGGETRSVVRKDVTHGVAVDGERISDMNEDISSNELIMRALNALNFNEDDVSNEEVEEQLSAALTPDMDPDAPPQPDEGALEELDDVMNASMGDVFDDAGFGEATAPAPEPATRKALENMDATTEFINSLLLDEDGDDE